MSVKNAPAAAKKAQQPADKADPSISQEKRKPIHTIRVDDVSASIWSRRHMVQGEERTFYSVTFERSYKDRDGSYKYTKSFDFDSLGKLVTVAQQAHEWIDAAKEEVVKKEFMALQQEMRRGD